MLVGSSSWSAAFAAIKLAKNLNEKAVIVVLFPNTGRNYLSKLFDYEWMTQNNLL